jgi:hypothetical protein
MTKRVTWRKLAESNLRALQVADGSAWLESTDRAHVYVSIRTAKHLWEAGPMTWREANLYIHGLAQGQKLAT